MDRYIQTGVKKRGTAGIAAAVVAVSLALAGPASAGEDLVSYQTDGRLKVAKKVKYRFVCSVDCQVTVTSELVTEGSGDVAPLTKTGTFEAGIVVGSSVRLPKSLRKTIRDNLGTSKLRTGIKASSLSDGVTDTDRRTFKFKR
jgi:hypothetical protein